MNMLVKIKTLYKYKTKLVTANLGAFNLFDCALEVEKNK